MRKKREKDTTKFFLSSDMCINSVVFVTGCSLLFLSVAGYRPFPSIDDFHFIPFLLKSIDPDLFKGDLAIEQYTSLGRHFHGLVKALLSIVPLPWLYFSLTIVLALGTGWLSFLLLRRLGGNGKLLPLLLYGTGGTFLIGVGRGSFDGLFGHAFHPQWVGLLLLLAAYFFLLQGRDKWCGISLGVASYFHPTISYHGFFIVACALSFESGFTKPPFWRRFVMVIGIGVIIGLPLLMTRGCAVTRALLLNDSSSLSIKNIIAFRYPHEYTAPLSWKSCLMGAWLLLLGVAAMITSHAWLKRKFPIVAGLLVGHSFLLICYLVAGYFWVSYPLWIHRLHFSRTTPVLIFLLNLVIVAAIEGSLLKPVGSDIKDGPKEAQSAGGLMGAVLFASHGSWCLIGGVVNRWYLVLPLLIIVLPLLPKGRVAERAHKALVGFLLLLALIGITCTPREMSLEKSERELFDWCQTSTDNASIFIVPPKFFHFRIFAKRPVYCAFRPFFTNKVAFELKERLIQTCNPDKQTVAHGWKALDQWERTYLRRNPPARIAHLLAETEAIYWLQDRASQTIPPFYPPVPTGGGTALTVAFSNDRFSVYSLKTRE